MLFITTHASIVEQQLPLAQLITNRHFQDHPELEARYGRAGREKCSKDALFHLSYLAEAIRTESMEIFAAYIEWAQVMLHFRNIPRQDLIDNLKYLESACSELLPAGQAELSSVYINHAIQRINKVVPLPGSCITAGNPLQAYATEYLELLLQGNRARAQSLILDLVKKGQHLPDIYEYIFQATQHEVGRLWQINKITVAHEHFCTAATQSIMASLYSYIFKANEKKTGKMLACAISDDLHEVGIRMVADVFEMNKWDTYYLGANMPDTNIISALKEQKADLLALSVTMPFHVARAENLVKKIRNDDGLSDLKIMVGGYPFLLIPGLWSRIGADGWAKNATDALEMANKMISVN